jgi:hypothetical protein
VPTPPIKPDLRAVIPPEAFATLRALKAPIDAAYAAVAKDAPFGRRLPKVAKLIRSDLSRLWGSICKGLKEEPAPGLDGSPLEQRQDRSAA